MMDYYVDLQKGQILLAEARAREVITVFVSNGLMIIDWRKSPGHRELGVIYDQDGSLCKYPKQEYTQVE